jgi:hypothetical protein
MQAFRLSIFLLLILILGLGACTIKKNPTIFIDVYGTNYQPKLDPALCADCKGKAFILDSIRVEAPNATMLGYYSTDRNIRYTMNYQMGRPAQPIESFLWYSLQKSFTSVGITATNDNIADNALSLHLTFTFIDDQEAKFQLKLFRSGNLLAQKELIAAQKLPSTLDATELENRSYISIDLIAAAILNDPDFKRELLMNIETPAKKDAT